MARFNSITPTLQACRGSCINNKYVAPGDELEDAGDGDGDFDRAIPIYGFAAGDRTRAVLPDCHSAAGQGDSGWRIHIFILTAQRKRCGLMFVQRSLSSKFESVWCRK